MRLRRRLARWRGVPPGVAHLPAARHPAAGRALLSYLRDPVTWAPDDPRLMGHTNRWECRRIAHALAALGFAVDAIDFDDETATPAGRYDVVLALDAELVSLVDAVQPAYRLLHLTGSFAPFNNAAEEARIEALAERRGVRCAPRRMVADPEGAAAALALAEGCSLVGNRWVRDTYPPDQRDKIHCVPVTGSPLSARVRARDAVPDPREFLWFFGGGAVHKGLDLALEAFARRPELVLNVVGDLSAEADFVAVYRHELTALPNVRVHGFLTPDSEAFADVTERCFAFVAPSCAEATSTACVTLLQCGLYPIVSPATGLDLPDGCGRWLSEGSIDELEAVIAAVHAAPASALRDELAQTRRWALDDHSRERFGAAMDDYLRAVLDRG
jgi:hypothetical protein